MNSDKCIVIMATALAGVCTGSLAFVSFVDARSFLHHVSTNNHELVRKHFPVWWPNGRDYMVPLLGTTALANLIAWRTTGKESWGYAALAICGIVPYTVLVLGEDIEALRRSNEKKVAQTTQRFCSRHHARLGMAVIGFGMSLFGLTEFKD
jgi:hypothetical protein